MRKPKVVVVGAGPSGGACALGLARSGRFEVVLLDKSHYPRVKVCGSGLSPLALRMLDEMGLRAGLAHRAVRVHALQARGPDGHSVRFDSGKGGAWVVPRLELDSTIVRAAEAAGAVFREQTKVTEVLRGPSGAISGVRSEAGDEEADVVVFANGSPSRFERDKSPRVGIRTLMGWWKGFPLPEHEGVMIWDRELDGYYLWAFPEPDGIVNVGLTIPEGSSQARGLRDLFQTLLDRHFARELSGAELVRKWMGHPATVTTQIGDIAESRGIYVGEAARLVCPGTVEGISYGLLSGCLAARHLERSFDPATGWDRRHIASYRAALALRVLPTFLAGAALARGMANPQLNRLGGQALSGWTGAAFNGVVQWVLGTHARAD